MRRFTGFCALLALLSPVALRLATAGEDSAAVRCALACGHTVTPGVACCPMSGAAGKSAAMAACPGGDPQSAAPTVPAQPAIFAAIHRLAAPQGGSTLASFSSVAQRLPSARPLDHVPLLLF